MNLEQVTQEIRVLIGDARIFGATFRRRDGSVRTGSFRLGVRARGVTWMDDGQRPGLAYNPSERGNLIVWDMQAGGYRTIRLRSLISLRVRGRIFNASPRRPYFRESRV